MNILFVCTGNTCRSPMAEALLKKHAPALKVKSAGIFAGDGETANPHAIAVLQEKTVDIDHASQRVTEELLLWADAVLTMTEGHKQLLASDYPGFQHKVRTLIEFTDENAGSIDIGDPFGGPVEVYRETISELEGYIKKLSAKLARK